MEEKSELRGKSRIGEGTAALERENPCRQEEKGRLGRNSKTGGKKSDQVEKPRLERKK